MPVFFFIGYQVAFLMNFLIWVVPGFRRLHGTGRKAAVSDTESLIAAQKHISQTNLCSFVITGVIAFFCRHDTF
jgi:hypothetical protein